VISTAARVAVAAIRAPWCMPMAVGRVVKVAAMVAAMPPVMARAVKVALAVRPMLPVRRAARVAALVASATAASAVRLPVADRRT
jgi:hypothetical protein